MTKLPTKISWKKIVKILEKKNFRFSSQRGSHYVMINDQDYNPPRIVTIIMKNKYKKHTLSSILNEAGIGRDEFLKLLRKK